MPYLLYDVATVKSFLIAKRSILSNYEVLKITKSFIKNLFAAVDVVSCIFVCIFNISPRAVTIV